MINQDDPRLTAYALNEIDESEEPSTLVDINNGNGCFAHIDVIRDEACLLSEAFDLEPNYGLTEEQKNKIFKETGLLAVTKSGDVLPDNLMLFDKESSKYEKTSNVVEIVNNEVNKKAVFTSLVAAAAVIVLTMVLLNRQDVIQHEVSHKSSVNEALLSVEIIDEKSQSPKKKEMWIRRQIAANSVATDHPFRYGKPLINSAESDKLAFLQRNKFKDPSTFDNRLSFFSPNIGTQSYEELRRLILAGKMPTSDGINVCELINAFDYNYNEPKTGDVFSVSTEFISCPWAPERLLLCIGVRVLDRGKPQSEEMLRVSNVKMAVEFNPARISGYRPIGESEASSKHFEELDQNILLEGQSVTVMYEIIPEANKELKLSNKKSEVASIRINYGDPISGELRSMLSSVSDSNIKSFEESSDDTRFAASVAGYGLILENKNHSTKATYDLVLELANNALGKDKNGKRSEFIDWVMQTRAMNKIK